MRMPALVWLCAADGRIQHSARPGNARGNGLSTNAAAPRAWPITEYTWADGDTAASVRVPLAPLTAGGAHTKGSQPVAQRVRASFSERGFELEVTDETERLYRLRMSELPGSLDLQVRRAPAREHARASFRALSAGLTRAERQQACRHRVEDAGADAAVVLTLAKTEPAERWATLGVAARAVKRPSVTVRHSLTCCQRTQQQSRLHAPLTVSACWGDKVTSYTWSDEKAGVRVWVRVPGVHTVPLSAVRVRFRELSFDVSVADLGGKDYTFAVRTLARARRRGSAARDQGHRIAELRLTLRGCSHRSQSCRWRLWCPSAPGWWRRTPSKCTCANGRAPAGTSCSCTGEEERDCTL